MIFARIQPRPDFFGFYPLDAGLRPYKVIERAFVDADSEFSRFLNPNAVASKALSDCSFQVAFVLGSGSAWAAAPQLGKALAAAAQTA